MQTSQPPKAAERCNYRHLLYVLVSIISLVSGGHFSIDYILLSDILMAVVVGAAGGQ